MNTCVRGFSYMPERLEVNNLKYVDGEELEQTWKSNRRQRMKQQEQKIWEEFIKEQDVINSVCQDVSDDRYQFIDQLPEDKIKEMLEEELEAMTKEREDNAEQLQEIQLASERESAAEAGQHVVFVAEPCGAPDNEHLIHIFDDDNNDDSGAEDEVLNETLSPPLTVRERAESPDSPNNNSEQVHSTKSCENVTNVIETSIYCAKVKDLRLKIAAELNDIISTLENKDIMNIDPADIPKMMKRSAEFCARFNRIHMYQLSRQIQDVRRNNSHPLPFARYTHFQSQMVRVASLHHNALHSLQVFHKSIQQTACMRESGDMLKSLAQSLDEMGDACAALAVPSGLQAATNLYTDSVPLGCQQLRAVCDEYSARLSEFLNSTDNTSVSCSKRSSRLRRKSCSTWSKSAGPKSFGDTEPRLSMYSLELNLHTRSNTTRDNYSGGTSKVRACVSGRTKASDAVSSPAKGRAKKSPRARRPLMRDPQEGKPRRKPTKDTDVTTLVESVANCASSHMSRDNSQSPKELTPRRRKITQKFTKKQKRTPRATSGDNTNTSPINKTSKKDTESSYRGDPDSVKMTPRRYIDLLTPINIPPILDTSNKVSATTDRDAASSLITSPSKGPDTTTYNKTPRKDLPRVTPKKDTDDWHSKITPRKDPKLKGNLYTHSESREVHDKETEDVRDAVRKEEGRRSERDKKASDVVAGCEVSKLLRQLCGADAAGNKNERISGVKNAQLVCVSGGSPRQPSTPQLLRILEETIQKKTPRATHRGVKSTKNLEKFRMTLNIPEQVTEDLFQYRSKFIHHMLTSSMYANSALGKPWEVISRVSEQIIDDLLLRCANEMEIQEYMTDMYRSETC